MRKKLQALIVEDDADNLEQLTDLLSEFTDIVEITDVAMTVTEAATFLAKRKYDISFLDYELDNNQDLRDLVSIVGVKNLGIPVMNTKTKGDFELTEKLGRILFLPKPYSEVGMLSFISKLQDRINGDSIQAEKDTQNCYFKMSGDTLKVASGDIYYIEGRRNYSDVYCKGREFPYTVSGTISEIEESLPPHTFIRCHKSFIVNPAKVYKAGRSGTFGNRCTLYFDESNPKLIAYYSDTYRDALIKAGVIRP